MSKGVKEVKLPRSFIIRNKNTGELWVSRRGKRTWAAPGHAKNAWLTGSKHLYREKDVLTLCERLNVMPTTNRYGSLSFPKIDEQDTWEVVETGLEAKATLDEAKKLLRLCLGRITDSYIENKVMTFLENSSDSSKLV